MKSLFRTLSLAFVGLALLAFVYFIAPDKGPVVAYKLSVDFLAAYAGYWADRSIFKYARPHTLLDNDAYAPSMFSLATIRRAIIVAAFVIGAQLGL